MSKYYTFSFVTLLFLLFQNLSLAQDHFSCDGERYINDVFGDISVTREIKFGEGQTIGGNFQELFMDIYEPANDAIDARPAIVLAFGGAYIGGAREDLDWLCEAYAAKGYVAVTIDYRIYDLPLFPFPTDEEMQEVVVKSISDMKAAIRFLREDADTDNVFKVDPDQIYCGGISAGAITASHTAVIDPTDMIDGGLLELIEENGGFNGNSSPNTSYSSDVKGFINFSGGLSDAALIDAEDPPFVSIHDEFDPTVPYGGGFANVFGVDIIYMEGSQLMHERAEEVSIENKLYTIEGSSGHVSYFSPITGIDESRISQTAQFVHDQICGQISSTSELSQGQLVSIYPNPSKGQIFITKEAGQTYSYKLYSVYGELINSWKDVTQIDLSGMPGNMYFLQVTNHESNQIDLRKIYLID